jgi:hypothetical protein
MSPRINRDWGHKMLTAKWRDFHLNGGVLSVGRIPLDEGIFTWSLQFDSSSSYWNSNERKPNGGGRTLREAFGELRREMALANNPRAKKLHERIVDAPKEDLRRAQNRNEKSKRY